jgi:hypothetical protein
MEDPNGQRPGFLCAYPYLGLSDLKSIMYYVLFYKTIDNYIEKRAPFREEHLKLADAARNNGTLIMAGALADLLMRHCLFSKQKARRWRRTSPGTTRTLKMG